MTFLAKDRAPLLHLGRSPRGQRPLISARRWRKAYPFVAAHDPKHYAETIHWLRAESAYLRYTPWLLDPDARLALAAATLEYLTTQLPLAPGDLNLPVVSARLFGVHAPTEIGPVAPRLALILYALSSLGAPLRKFRDPSARLIDQLAEAVRRRIESAPPADLVAVHVLMLRLLTMSREPWAEAALDLCLPLSPLTRLLENSNQLAALAPYHWRGVEMVLCGFGLEGLQVRCSQALIDSTLPGWDWHTVEEPVRYARFRRASEVFNRLAWALNNADRPAFGPIRAMRLATWLLRTYRLFGRALDVYQRIVLPPPLDPGEPGPTPSFRLLRQFVPSTPEGIREHVAGLAAPIRPVMALLVEASRITSTPVYIPDELPVAAWPVPFAPNDALNVVAAQLIDAWRAMDAQYGPLLGNLYQFVTASLGNTPLPGEFNSEGDLATLGQDKDKDDL
jgi:hypothetical protein